MMKTGNGRRWRRRAIGAGVGVITMAMTLPSVAQNYQQDRQQRTQQDWNQSQNQRAQDWNQSQNRRDWDSTSRQQGQSEYEWNAQSRQHDRYTNQQDWQQQQRQRYGSGESQLMRVDPNSWIRVGYDFDRDGRIDAVEDISARELQQMSARSDRDSSRDQQQWRDQDRRQQQARSSERDRQMSDQQWRDQDRRQQQARSSERDRQMSDQQWRDQERRQQQARSSERERQMSDQNRMQQRGDMGRALWDRDGQQGRQQNQTRSAFHSLQGSIDELRRQTIGGSDKEHLVARVDTGRGMATVDLGPQDNLSEIELEEGDTIQVSGTLGRISGQQVLMAHRIQSGSDSIFVERESPMDARRFQGQIQDIRDVAFRDSDQEFKVATVRLEDGRTASVNLGPTDDLDDLDLQQGDDIRILARPGQIDGQMALIADELWANDQNVNIDHPDDRQEFEMAARGTQQGQQGARQQQGQSSQQQQDRGLTAQERAQSSQQQQQRQSNQQNQESGASEQQRQAAGNQSNQGQNEKQQQATRQQSGQDETSS